MNKRRTIPYLALLVTFLLWVYFKPEVDPPSLPKHHPSYIADDVLSNHYDQFGFNDYRIFADKMESYPEKEISLFELPKVIFNTKDEITDVITTWQLTSDKGILKQKDTLLLSGNVLIENLSKDQLIQTMVTNKATITLDKKEITSKSKVTWRGPQIQQEGVGMWISMVTKEMTLNSNIKAIYLNEPK